MSLSGTCRHALQASRAQCAGASRLAHNSSRLTPLFLDFLAPAWSRSTIATTPPARHRKIRSERLSGIYSSTRRHLSTTSSRNATAVANPRTDDDGKAMTINITPRAEHRLRAIAEKDKNPELALRVSVESGGCHGFQYLMKLINTSDIDQGDDTVFENANEQDGFKARVVMDEPSLELLKGSSIDYTMELIGSQFKVTGIPGAKSSCGCGTSFDIAS